MRERLEKMILGAQERLVSFCGASLIPLGITAGNWWLRPERYKMVPELTFAVTQACVDQRCRYVHDACGLSWHTSWAHVDAVTGTHRRVLRGNIPVCRRGRRFL